MSTRAFRTSKSIDRVVIAAMFLVIGPWIVFHGYSKGGIFGAAIACSAVVIALAAHFWAESARMRQSDQSRLDDPNQ